MTMGHFQPLRTKKIVKRDLYVKKTQSRPQDKLVSQGGTGLIGLLKGLTRPLKGLIRPSRAL